MDELREVVAEESAVDSGEPAEAQLAVQEAEREFETTDLPGYTPASEEQARLFRYVRLRVRMEEEIARVKAQAAAMTRALESRVKALDYLHQGFASELVRRELEAQTGKKAARSVKTPYGTVGFRATGGSVVIADEAVFLKQAEADKRLAACVRTERRVLTSEVARLIKETGELPDGVEFSEKQDKFYVSAPREVKAS